MKINSTAPASLPVAPPATPKGLSKPAQGHAYGVLKKLGTDHYHATAQARLMAKFGHLLPPTELPTTGEPPATDAPPTTDTGSTDTGSTTPTDTTTGTATTTGVTDPAGTTIDVVA